MKGKHQDHDEDCGCTGSRSHGLSDRHRSQHPESPPDTDSPRNTIPEDARDVARLTRELLDWHRPDFAGVSRFRGRDQAYWNETGKLVLEYLALQAAPHDVEQLRRGFVAWLKDSPDALKQYEDADDMARAALVDRYVFRKGQ